MGLREPPEPELAVTGLGCLRTRPATRADAGAVKRVIPSRNGESLSNKKIPETYQLLGGTCVQRPCATPTTIPTLSRSVDGVWMLLPFSSASAPISIVSTIPP